MAQIDGHVPVLHRVLGFRDLVLLNIAAVVGLRWLSTAAQIGPSSLGLWSLALLVFFVPLALAVLELSSRLPGEGGLYLWSKAAFGDLHGFIAGWCYWISNMVFFPTLLLFLAGISVYIAGDRWLPLAGSAVYNSVYCLAALWAATILNIFGLERARWLQNIGGIAIWLTTALILLAAGVAWQRFGAATPITPASAMPDFGSLSTYATLAIIAGAYTGLELGPILGGEIREPRRTIPRALLLAGVLIAVIYLLGTLALLVALPTRQIDMIGGIPQALAAVGDRIGLPFFGSLTASLLTLVSLGGLGAWITGTARLPLVFGVDRYLPAAMATLHPRYATPHVALLTQAAIVSVILVATLSGSAIHEAYLILIDMTLILTFIPLLYLFASLPALRRQATGGDEAITRVPGGRLGCWLVTGLGLGMTALTIVTSLVPPANTVHPGLFFLKVGGGCCVLIGIGLAFYSRGRSRLQLPAVASATA